MVLMELDSSFVYAFFYGSLVLLVIVFGAALSMTPHGSIRVKRILQRFKFWGARHNYGLARIYGLGKSASYFPIDLNQSHFKLPISDSGRLYEINAEGIRNESMNISVISYNLDCPTPIIQTWLNMKYKVTEAMLDSEGKPVLNDEGKALYKVSIQEKTEPYHVIKLSSEQVDVVTERITNVAMAVNARQNKKPNYALYIIIGLVLLTGIILYAQNSGLHSDLATISGQIGDYVTKVNSTITIPTR